MLHVSLMVNFQDLHLLLNWNNILNFLSLVTIASVFLNACPEELWCQILVYRLSDLPRCLWFLLDDWGFGNVDCLRKSVDCSCSPWYKGWKNSKLQDLRSVLWVCVEQDVKPFAVDLMTLSWLLDGFWGYPCCQISCQKILLAPESWNYWKRLWYFESTVSREPSPQLHKYLSKLQDSPIAFWSFPFLLSRYVSVLSVFFYLSKMASYESSTV